jgi:hypothetical protein
MNSASEPQAGLNDLHWPLALSLAAFDVPFGVRATDPTLLDALRPYLPPGWAEAAPVAGARQYSIVAQDAPPRIRLYAGDNLLGEASALQVALEMFASDVGRHLAQYAPQAVFIHAGAVGWQDEVILVPGRSYSGKTRLVEALLRLGGVYYSDEFAVLDEAGQVHPYPRPLRMRPDAESPAAAVPADDLPAETAERPAPVGMIVLTKFRAGACWQPEPRTPGQGALALLGHSAARQQPERTMAAVRNAVSSATVVRSLRGDAAETAAAILKDFERYRGRPALRHRNGTIHAD